MSKANKKNGLERWLGSKNLLDLLIYGKCLLVWLASIVVYRNQLRIGFLPLIEAFPLIRGRGQVRIGKHARIGGKVIVRFDDPESHGTLEIGDRFTSDGTVRICPRGGQIKLGTNVFFGPDTLVQSYKDSKIAIGNNVMIAAGCKIFGSNHSVDNEATPMRTKPEVAKGIVIEDDVWIGAQACLLDGITIGTGAVVAAGAVVTKPVAPGTIVAGVPARVISRR